MCLGITVIASNAYAELIVADADTDYYAPITATGGNALLGQVHDLITTTHKKYTSYDDCKNPTYIRQTDPGSSSSYIMEFYSQADISGNWEGGSSKGTWNREHVWCQSLSNGLWGTSGGGSDLHHIRPAEYTLNSTRGNNKYGLVSNRESNKKYYKSSSNDQFALGGYCANSIFEPLDNVKGDVARIVMYVYTHYNTYGNVYGTTNGSGSASFGTLKFTNVMSANSESAAISMLLEWHKNDPVDQIEIARNEAVYSIQGNKNPFVDHPEYANYIWGDGTPAELKSISLNKTSLTLGEGKSEQLTVTPNPLDASPAVIWTSSNENVATVSSTGMVTAKSAGTATITATSTENSQITASAQVTVEKSSHKLVTITLDSFDLTYGYGFKNWAEGEISGIAYVYGGSSQYPITGRMQFNKNQSSYYLASNTPTNGAIKSVTVNLCSGETERDFKLLTSNTPYGEVAGKPTNGTDRGTKTITAEGTTWEISGEDTYFALTYEFPSAGTSAAAYLYSITIEYGEAEGGDVGGDEGHICRHVCDICGKCTDETCFDAVCADKCAGHAGEEDTDKLLQFHAAVEGIITNGTLAKRLASINKAIAAYQALSSEERALAAEDIAALQAAISDYNQTVAGYNDEAERANNAIR